MHIRSPAPPLMVALLASTFVVVDSAMAQNVTKTLTPEALTWTNNPALPKGFESVILIGDPTTVGEVVVQRIRLPAHAQVPPHTHPFAETITVISGSAGFGLGDKVETSGEMLRAGGFFAHPANDPHYVWTDAEGAIVQIQFIAPGGIDYIDPADDPRKKSLPTSLLS